VVEGHDQEFIDTLILEGALVIKGIDSRTGEIMYSFTEKLKEMAPDLYDGFLELIHLSIMSLWEQGFVKMDPTEDNPSVLPSDLALDENNWSSLSQTDYQTLSALMRSFRGEA